MWTWLARIYEDAATGRLGPANNPAVRTLVEVVHVAIVLVRETVRDRLHVRAAMLAFWSAVAIVPIFLVGFALLGPLGLTETTSRAVRRVLYDTILASSVEEVGAAFDALLVEADIGTFGILGMAGIMFIGAQLYFNVEGAYNDIFRTRVRRSWLLRFTLFYAGITLGPLLIASGFVLTSRLGAAEAGPFLSRLLPVLLTGIALVGAIRLLPCSPVSWRASLAGGLSSAVLFEVVKFGFGAYTNLLGTRDNLTQLYGSVAALVPVFLLWMYVLWLVLLFGVEIAYLVQNHGTLLDLQRRLAVDRHALRRVPDGFFALAVLAAVSERFLSGHGSVGADEIADSIGAEPRHVHAVLDVLQDAGFVALDTDSRYLPARPPDRIPASTVLQRWRDLAAPEVHGPTAGAVRRAGTAVDGALAGNLASLAGVRRPKKS